MKDAASAYVRLALLVVLLLPFEEQLDGFDVVLADGVQQRVRHLDAAVEEHLDQLEALVLDGDHERRPAERVRAVDVQLAGLVFELVQQAE